MEIYKHSTRRPIRLKSMLMAIRPTVLQMKDGVGLVLDVSELKIVCPHSDNVPMRSKSVCSRPELLPTLIGLVMRQCVRRLYPFR